MLGHKMSLHKFSKLEIALCIFSDHNPVKLEIINYKYKEIKQLSFEEPMDEGRNQ
jgi:hypothetical protein